MKPRTFWPIAIVVIGLAGLLAVFLFRGVPPPDPVSGVPRDVPATNPAPSPAVPPPTLPPGRPTSSEPLLRKWQTSIAQRDAQGVMAAQAAFLEREGEYREPLMTMAKEDPDPRIRAFSVAALGRMKSPPPEQFFIDRLLDPSEHPRTSALEALKKVGTTACLPVVEGLATHGPEGLRAAAAEAAKAVRSR